MQTNVSMRKYLIWGLVLMFADLGRPFFWRDSQTIYKSINPVGVKTKTVVSLWQPQTEFPGKALVVAVSAQK